MRITSQSHACTRRRWVREHPRKRVAPSCRHGLLCGAQATGALEVSTCMWDDNWSIFLMTSAESMSDKTVGRRGWETDQRNQDRLGTRSSLHPNKRNEESMCSRAWSNPQLSMEPKEETRRRAAARAYKDEMNHLKG